VKEFLHAQNVTFTDRDVTSDDSAIAELGGLGVMTTPVTVVDGQIVVGYDVNRLKALLSVRLDPKTHWEHVYATKAPDAVSWFQSEPTVSLRLLDAAGIAIESCLIDIGGGDSRLVDRLVERQVRAVFVLDVSGAALARAKARLGEGQARVTWIEADVTGDWNVPTVDIWHDRAVFHFLTGADDRQRYVAHLRRAVRPGGAVVMATFALDGPAKCSGLPVVRYSPETLNVELGSEFRVEDSVGEQHRTPSGAVQSFCYTRFRRVTA
jgi:SAM-dependent methyltransferase